MQTHASEGMVLRLGPGQGEGHDLPRKSEWVEPGQVEPGIRSLDMR